MVRLRCNIHFVFSMAANITRCLEDTLWQLWFWWWPSLTSLIIYSSSDKRHLTHTYQWDGALLLQTQRSKQIFRFGNIINKRQKLRNMISRKMINNYSKKLKLVKSITGLLKNLHNKRPSLVSPIKSETFIMILKHYK